MVIDVRSLQALANGGFLVHANVQSGPALFRFASNGTLDTTFGVGGVKTWPNTQLSPSLFILPTTGPQVAVLGNQAFVTGANTYTDALIPSAVLFERVDL